MFSLVDGHEQNHHKALSRQSIYVFCHPSSPLTRACPASNCYALSTDDDCIGIPAILTMFSLVDGYEHNHPKALRGQSG